MNIVVNIFKFLFGSVRAYSTGLAGKLWTVEKLRTRLPIREKSAAHVQLQGQCS